MFKSTDYDKAPLQSKKFLAYMCSSMLMKIYLFFATARGEGDVVIIQALTMTVFLDVGYILGQAGLDALTRHAAIMSSKKNQPDS
jgi:hypothetical protein